MIQISQLMKLNIIKFKSTFFLILISFSYLSFSQNNDKLTLGADQIDFFIDDLKGKIDLVPVQYEYQYLYVLYKPE